MDLDFDTLTIAGALVAFVSGVLLLLAWNQYGGGQTALRFGGSHLLGAFAITLLALGSDNYALATLAAQFLFLLASALALSAVMAFEGRRTPLSVIAITAGGLALVLWLGSAMSDSQGARLVQLSMSASFFALSALALWRGRNEHLIARWPLVIVLIVHSAVILVGLIETVAFRALPAGVPSFSDWYGVVHVESMIYFIGTAVFFVAMMKERSERRHETAAHTDPLTGLPNRRAFFNNAERLLERRRRDGVPTAMVAIDLDRFKAVNDIFGHAVGDSVLRIFAQVVQDQLRFGDLVGRLGGEEFAVLVPEATFTTGIQLAERIRQGFAEAAREVDGRVLNATLSAGVVIITPNTLTLNQALELADAALYRAKLNGRDRVELGEVPSPPLRLVASSG